MPYVRKTSDLWEIQGYYTPQYGWEAVTAEETFKEAKERIKEYRENEPGVSFRLKKKRVKIEQGAV